MAYFESGSFIVTSLPLHGVQPTLGRGGADHFLPSPDVTPNFLESTRPGIRTRKNTQSDRSTATEEKQKDQPASANEGKRRAVKQRER